MTATTASTRREQHQRYAQEHGLGSAGWRSLGTSVHLVVTAPEQLNVARSAVEAVLADIDLAASRFRDDSEVAAINAAGGGWTTVTPLMLQALRVALDAAAWTDGLVDPTVGGALIDFGYDRTFTLVDADGPTPVVHVRQIPGWQHVELDEPRSRVRVPAGTVVDLGATAKGLAAVLGADAAAAAADCGVLVSLGGDLSIAGESPKTGWVITVGDTSDLDAAVGTETEQTVIVRAGGLATSSIRARRWRRGGSELHHLIDPRITAPSQGTLRTVSVTASTCTLANTASTAAIILGADAPAWLESRGFPARLVARNGTVRYVGGWPQSEASR